MDSITTVSNYMKEYLISRGVNNDIKLIYNGLDLNYINIIKKNKSTDDTYLYKKRKLNLIFPGGQKEGKGGKIILEALNSINTKQYSIKLFYCGHVNKDFINRYKSEWVEFTGQLDRDKYLRLLSMCDALILLSHEEACPISIMEAMALGKTIITTPVGGIPEIFKNNRNGVYAKRNAEDVAEKVLLIYRNLDLRKKFAKNNIVDFKYSLENIAKEYMKLYRSIMR